MGVYLMCHRQRQSLIYAPQSTVIARASTGPWYATLLAGSESCLHLCYWLQYSVSIGASDDFKHSMLLNSGALIASETFWLHFLGMYTVTSRAVSGVQLLSNKMKWGVHWRPRASHCSSKWRVKLSAPYFVAFDVPLIGNRFVLPY